ncbi:MAG: hypothetical protein KKC76_03035 [Proteobacteria bacterium]|nr:hypothetical protein [Pseudomonadota bacterium]MBU4294736.1 hypothetical protein [Pseudomonadota bacterium]MCG2746486.1 hypothetical protein [Desulfobulbaceae bacterium]
MDKPLKAMQLAVLVFLVVTAPALKAIAGAPIITDVRVTDVTPQSFSVIWISSEASSPDLHVFDDPDGLVPTADALIIPHPVASGNNDIVLAAEDNGVMKVRVTGLAPETSYYFQTVTTSLATSDVTLEPAGTPLLSVTTESRLVKSKITGEAEIPFTNDLIAFDCYFQDGVTPAEGTLLVAELEGGKHPVSNFVGDGISIPKAYADLNNLFNSLTSENMPLSGGEKITLTKFMGIHGVVVADYIVPANDNLGEIKQPVGLSSCPGDLNDDGDEDGLDMAVFVDAYAANDLQADLNNSGTVDESDVALFAADFGRTDCKAN